MEHLKEKSSLEWALIHAKAKKNPQASRSGFMFPEDVEQIIEVVRRTKRLSLRSIFDGIGKTMQDMDLSDFVMETGETGKKFSIVMHPNTLRIFNSVANETGLPRNVVVAQGFRLYMQQQTIAFVKKEAMDKNALQVIARLRVKVLQAKAQIEDIYKDNPLFSKDLTDLLKECLIMLHNKK